MPERGHRVVAFAERNIIHYQTPWAGKPFKLFPWERDDIVMPLFGWIRSDGTRRYRRAGIWMAKKNGKSTLCGFLSLYLLCADGEQGAEVYSAAGDREQASHVYRAAAGFVEASPRLRRIVQLIPSTKRILHKKSMSYYRVLSAEGPSKQEGHNAHGLFFDELHVQRNRTLWDSLYWSGRARQQPLHISISTAGYDLESIGYEQYKYACDVRDGRIKDTAFLPFVCEIGPDDDWTQEETWKRANPSWGLTFKAEDVRADFEAARAVPGKQPSFRRYILNQWVDQPNIWISREAWSECEHTGLAISQFKGCPAWIGIDLASTQDTTAIATLVRKDGISYLFVDFFLPDNELREREQTDHTRYTEWAADGWLTLMPGKVRDDKYLRRRLVELGDLLDVRYIGFDPWASTGIISDLVEEDGFDAEKIVTVRQGTWTLNEPSNEFERMVMGKTLSHEGSPMMAHQVSHTAIKTGSNEDIRPDKARSTSRIDGVVATVTAIAVWLEKGKDTTTEEKPSVYEERGVLWV